MSELHYRATQPPQVWRNNPVLVQLLGLSPLLSVSTSAVKGIALGLATAIVLVLSSLTVSLCRHLPKREWRFVFFMMVLAVYTTLITILVQLYYYSLSRELGVYLPLICCNMALLLHLETQTLHESTMANLRGAGITACGLLLALTGFALLREFLITGYTGTNWQMLLPDAMAGESGVTSQSVPDQFPFARLAPAALILFGILLALRNALLPGLLTQCNE